jgi:predicted RNase H-like nuclease (RuvC/YqgF family)
MNKKKYYIEKFSSQFKCLCDLNEEIVENNEFLTQDIKKYENILEQIKSNINKDIKHKPELYMIDTSIRKINKKNIKKIKNKLHEYLYFYYFNDIKDNDDIYLLLKNTQYINSINEFLINHKSDKEFYITNDENENILKNLLEIEMNLLKHY